MTSPSKPERETTYLGDAVYVAMDRDSVRLTTDSHNTADAYNVIYLEPEVLQAFLAWLAPDTPKEATDETPA